MSALWSLLLAIGLLLLAVPVAVLAAQVWLACGPTPHPRPPVEPAPDALRMAVLIPAHNEAAGIAATLESVRAQLGPSDQMVVVADNCTDDTAAMAARGGALVTERHNDALRGKGYALDHGVRWLAANPPDVVVVIDADCQIAAGNLRQIAMAANAAGRPAQALYLMDAPEEATLKTRIASFAWLVRNHVRPLGWYRRGWPCQLMGSGMAFPWDMIESAPLATGNLVEDMQLGTHLAARGSSPLLVPEVIVNSTFPMEQRARTSQRVRWEHGHLETLLQVGPRLMWQALTQGNGLLAAFALDLCVPPLASLVLIVSTALALSAASAVLLGASTWPFWITLVYATALTVTVARAWRCFGRNAMRARDWLALPAYVLGKVSIYWHFSAGKRQKSWVRTGRDGESRPS